MLSDPLQYLMIRFFTLFDCSIHWMNRFKARKCGFPAPNVRRWRMKSDAKRPIHMVVFGVFFFVASITRCISPVLECAVSHTFRRLVLSFRSYRQWRLTQEYKWIQQGVSKMGSFTFCWATTWSDQRSILFGPLVELWKDS